MSIRRQNDPGTGAPDENGVPAAEDEERLVATNHYALKKLVNAKTPFTMEEFERAHGWDFLGESPAYKRELAWKTINLPKSTQQELKKKLAEVYAAFPLASISDYPEKKST